MNDNQPKQPVTTVREVIRREVVKAQYGTIGELTDSLESAINTIIRQELEWLVEQLPDTTFYGSSIRVKENIRDGGYHDGVRDSRAVINKRIKEYEG